MLDRYTMISVDQSEVSEALILGTKFQEVPHNSVIKNNNILMSYLGEKKQNECKKCHNELKVKILNKTSISMLHEPYWRLRQKESQ